MNRDEMIEAAKEFFHKGKCAYAFDAFTVGCMADFALQAVRDERARIAERLQQVAESANWEVALPALIDELEAKTDE